MKIVVMMAAALLVGCAPATLQGVRDLGPDKSYKFSIDQNYQNVYRTVLDRSRQCHQGGLITAQMVVQGDLYHDTQSGTVSVALHGGFGVDTYQVIDIVATSDATTDITAHYGVGPVERQGKLLERWVRENYPHCK